MWYLYILHSKGPDKYYVGISQKPEQRLFAHNHSDRITFTSKFRPWKMVALFECGENAAVAMEVEKFVKKQKSRKLLEMLVVVNFTPLGNLAQLVRVPYLRD